MVASQGNETGALLTPLLMASLAFIYFFLLCDFYQKRQTNLLSPVVGWCSRKIKSFITFPNVFATPTLSTLML